MAIRKKSKKKDAKRGTKSRVRAKFFTRISPYGHLQRWFDELLGGQTAHKSPSLVILEYLARTKPNLAKQIFLDTAMRAFLIALQDRERPRVLSEEGRRYVDDLIGRFTQEPLRSFAMLEALLIAELLEPLAEEEAMFLFQKPLAKIDTQSAEWEGHFGAKAQEYAHLEVLRYARDRNYRIALRVAEELGGGSAEAYLQEIQKRRLEGVPTQYHYLLPENESLLGHAGVSKFAGWIAGDIKF